MFLKIISTILYVMAGFFIYMVSLISFINLAPLTVMQKFGIMAVFCIPLVVCILIAAALNKFKKWRSAVAISIFSGIGVTSFCIITFASFYLSPETRKYFPKDVFAGFSDYISGIGTILTFLGMGIVLFLSEKRKAAYIIGGS